MFARSSPLNTNTVFMNQFVNVGNIEAALQVCLSVPAAPLQPKYYSVSCARAICEHGAAQSLSVAHIKHLMVLFKESVWAEIFTSELLLSTDTNTKSGCGSGFGASSGAGSGAGFGAGSGTSAALVKRSATGVDGVSALSSVHTADAHATQQEQVKN